jgi:hypothetical protein
VPKQDDILQLQDEVTREVNGDAEELARQVFPTRGPDMSRVSNETLDRVYRQKYEAGDRKWLQAEAQRDPEQFLKVVERIGVTLPTTSVPGEIHPPPDATAIQAPPQLPPGPLPQALDVSQPQVAAQLPLPAVPQMPAPPPPTVPTIPQQMV